MNFEVDCPCCDARLVLHVRIGVTRKDNKGFCRFANYPYVGGDPIQCSDQVDPGTPYCKRHQGGLSHR